MDTIDLYEKIENYLLGRLPAGERAAFEAEMKADASLAEEVALHRNLIAATGEKDVLALRKKIEEVIAGDTGASKAATDGKYSWWSILRNRIISFGNRPSSSSQGSNWWLPAGAVLVAATLAVWFLRTSVIDKGADKQQIPPIVSKDEVPKKPQAPEQPGPDTPPEQKKENPTPQKQPETFLMALANDFYQKDADLEGMLMGEEISGDTQLDKAMAAYRKKDWSGAATLLQRIEDPEVEIESRQLRADANFKLKQYSKAAEDFKWLSENISIGKYQAEWNLLICYLAQGTGESKNFDTLLQKIKNTPQHPFAEKAIELERKMSR